MNIGVVGAGLVGRAVAEGLESKGHTVLLNDVVQEKSRFNKEELVLECEVIFICVDTPTDDRGCNLENVYNAFNDLHMCIAQATKQGLEPPVIAIKSTVIPGTVDTLHAMYPFVCSNPEFMREKSALLDFLSPSRIIVGAHSDAVFSKMKKLYSDFNAPLLLTSPRVAEAVKYLSNAYLVGKVAFAMQSAKLCEALRVDADEVMLYVGMDGRIGPSHLKPSMGKIPVCTPCLGKDVLALVSQMNKSGVDSTLFSVMASYALEGAKLKTSFKLEVE